VHQVGFSLHDYIEMHGQQNVKNKTLLSVPRAGWQSYVTRQPSGARNEFSWHV